MVIFAYFNDELNVRLQIVSKISIKPNTVSQSVFITE